ncbi:MAG: transcriptional regulator, TraR/DksA family [Polaromonas sp.]|nr:transcriptional regulator, TraR/DksA family [Polaromonas sp.]
MNAPASEATPADPLTDDDLRAMPASDYMNDRQLAFFRHKLSLLRDDMLDSVGGSTEFLRKEPLVVPDPVDRATVEEEHTMELDVRDRNQAFLQKIDQALARIDAGEYGYCEETGEEIGVERLLARPTANLSVEAQQRREHRQRTLGV